MKSISFVLATLLLTGAAVPAETMAAPAASGTAAAVTPTHLAAANELLHVARVDQRIGQSRVMVVDLMVRNNARLLPFRDVLETWTARFMNWEVLGPKIAELYATSFSERELRDLTRFFGTPLGQKWLDVNPDLMRALMEIGSAVGREHVAELESMVRERSFELQQAQKAQEATPAPADAPAAPPAAAPASDPH